MNLMCACVCVCFTTYASVQIYEKQFCGFNHVHERKYCVAKYFCNFEVKFLVLSGMVYCACVVAIIYALGHVQHGIQG